MNRLQIAPQTSLMRLAALDLLEQAYQTDSSQNLCREQANRLERILSHYFGQENEDFYSEAVVRLALHLSRRTYTGFYSETLNELLRHVDIRFDLPRWAEERLYPELYQNLELSEEEREKVKARYQLEKAALREAFLSAIGSIEPRFFRSQEDSDLEDLDSGDLYSICYNRACVDSHLQPTTTYSAPHEDQLLVEAGPQVISLPTKELLYSVIRDEVNPLTGKQYSQETLRRVRGKFQIELKLLRAKK